MLNNDFHQPFKQRFFIWIFLITVVTSFTTTGSAQRIEWGASTKTKSFPISTFDLGLIDGHYYYIVQNAQEKDRHNLFKLDAEAKLIEKTDLVGFRHKSIFAWVNGNEIYASQISASRKDVEYHKIDKSSGKALERITPFNPLTAGMMPLCLRTSLGSDRIGLFALEKKDKFITVIFGQSNIYTGVEETDALIPISTSKGRMLIFDAQYKQISETKFVIPQNYKKQRHVGATFDEYGNLFVAIVGSDGKSDGHLMVYKYDLEMGEFTEIDRCDDVGAIKQIDIEIYENGLSWSGMSKNGKDKNGLFVGQYDLISKNITLPTTKYTFSAEDVNLITGKKPKKSISIDSDYKLINTLFMPDASIVYVMENRKVISRTASLNSTNRMSVNNTLNGMTFKDIVILKCDNNNRVSWVKRMERKKSVTAGFTFAYGTFSCVLDGNIHLLYNENVNDGDLKSLIFNTEGDMQTKTIHDIGLTKKAIVPQFCTQDPNGDVRLMTFGWGGFINFGRYYAE